MHVNSNDIKSMPQRYRAHFINSLSGFKSANLIGSQDIHGNTNVAIVSSVFHLGADPALVGFINRPHSAPRHTLENIQEQGCYTINHVHSGMLKQAHQSSARYEKDQSEFDATGLNTEYSSRLAAPYVKESRIKFGIELREWQTLAINNTVLVIGEIVEIILPEGITAEDGFINIEAAGTIAVSGLDSYHSSECIERLPYAKV